MIKILLGCCVVEYDHKFVPSLINVIRDWDKSGKGELIFFPQWRRSLHVSQGCCVKEALEQECSHILFVEDDTTDIPSGALDILLKYDKDVVGAYAYARHFPHYPTIFKKKDGDKEKKWLDKITRILVNPDQGLQKVDLVPFQFTLIKTEVFKKIEPPYFWYSGTGGATDFWFADRCTSKGIDIWCDTNLIVQHAGIDGKTAGFYVWKGQMKDKTTGANWRPQCSAPFLKYAGYDISCESDDERIRQKSVCGDSKHTPSS